MSQSKVAQIMDIQHSPQSGIHNGNKVETKIDEGLLKSISDQLKTKDEQLAKKDAQIERLLEIVSGNGKSGLMDICGDKIR